MRCNSRLGSRTCNQQTCSNCVMPSCQHGPKSVMNAPCSICAINIQGTPEAKRTSKVCLIKCSVSVATCRTKVSKTNKNVKSFYSNMQHGLAIEYFFFLHKLQRVQHLHPKSLLIKHIIRSAVTTSSPDATLPFQHRRQHCTLFNN